MSLVFPFFSIHKILGYTKFLTQFLLFFHECIYVLIIQPEAATCQHSAAQLNCFSAMHFKLTKSNADNEPPKVITATHTHEHTHYIHMYMLIWICMHGVFRFVPCRSPTVLHTYILSNYRQLIIRMKKGHRVWHVNTYIHTHIHPYSKAFVGPCATGSKPQKQSNNGNCQTVRNLTAAPVALNTHPPTHTHTHADREAHSFDTHSAVTMTSTSCF